MFKKTYASLVLLLLIMPTVVLAASDAFSIAPGRGKSSWLLYEMKRGDSMKDSVVVVNLAQTQKTFTIQALDEGVVSNPTPTSFAMSNPLDEQKTIGQWVTLDQTEVTLEPNEKKRIGFTLTLPSDIENEKQYRGAIAISPAEKSAVEGGDGNSNKVSVATRVGVRLYVKATDKPGLTETTSAPIKEEVMEAEGSEEAETSEEESSNNLPYVVIGLVALGVVGVLFMKGGKK